MEKITYDELLELRDQDKARIIDTKADGTCQLWEVDGHSDRYVVDIDNNTYTQAEDNEDPDLALFPF